MSNVALFNPSQLPAFARSGELSDIAKALAGGGATGGKRISIKGGVFRLMSAGKEVAAVDERFLDVVIVKAAPKVSRVFYAAKYDGETAAQPDCWSPEGDKPDAKSANPQAATCESCPQNIAGSGNGQSRACRYQQRLAVVLANDIEGDVMQLALPATSIFGKEEGENRPLQAYARWLVAQSVDPSMVVTRMKFDTKAEAPKLHFKAMRWLTDDEFTQAGDQGKTDDALKAITMSVGATDNAKPADALQGAKPKAKAAPAPVVEEDDEEEAPAPVPAPKAAKKAKAAPAPVVEDEDEAEPEVRKAEKKPSAVPVKKSLADVVGGWDDED
jgi:hypothetical protein